MTLKSRGDRSSRRGRLVGLCGAAVTGLVTAVALGSPALAASVTGTAGADPGVQVQVKYPGENGKVWNHQASRISITIGGTRTSAYCIDIAHLLGNGKTYAEQEWSGSGVDNLGKIQWLLVNGYPAVPATAVAAAAEASTAGIDDIERLVYAANQVAIWHFSDGIKLNKALFDNGDTKYVEKRAFVKKVYDYLVARAAAAGAVAEPESTLEITPATANAVVGQAAGPFTVAAAGGTVTLSATNGTVVDATGAPLSSVAAGGKFWVKATATGQVKVSGAGQVTVPAGRIFTAEGHQKIILAGTLTTQLSAEATATFTATPVSPSPEVTSSGPASPLADASSGAAGSGGFLPVTGTSVATMVVVGLALVAGGVFAVATMRRRRVRFTAS